MKLGMIRLLGPLLALATIAGCAAEDASDPTVEGDQAELRALGTAEIAGEVVVDGKYHEIVLPAVRGRQPYRAFRVQLAGGESITAALVGADGSSPSTYLLGEDFRTLKRSDGARLAYRPST